MHAVYEPPLWITQETSRANPDFHHGLLVVMFVYAIEKHASEGLCFKGMIMVCVPTFGLVLVGFKTGNARLSEMQDERARAIHAKPFHYPPQHDDGAIENPRGQQW